MHGVATLSPSTSVYFTAWHLCSHVCRPHASGTPQGRSHRNRAGKWHAMDRSSCPPTQERDTSSPHGLHRDPGWQGAVHVCSHRGRGLPHGSVHGGHAPKWQLCGWRTGWSQSVGCLQRSTHAGGAVVRSLPQGTVTTAVPQAQATPTVFGHWLHFPAWQNDSHLWLPHARRRPQVSLQGGHWTQHLLRQRWRPQFLSLEHFVVQI